MNKPSILWVDDEIDLLTPHIMFLEQKGFVVHRCNSGADAITFCATQAPDLILLDENMPGLSGLETLTALKKANPFSAVIMVTNNQDDYLINNALGAQVSDFLLKPVLPNQVYISIVKVLDQRRLMKEKRVDVFIQENLHLHNRIELANSHKDFYSLYKDLVIWQLKIDSIEDPTVLDLLHSLFQTANKAFSYFVGNHYESWLKGENSPVMSHHLLNQKIIPATINQKTIVIVLDNLRLDHWLTIKPVFMEHFTVKKEELYMSLLPTVTQYARNAIFAGMTPLEIKNKFSTLWIPDHLEGLKNEEEAFFFEAYCNKNKLALKTSYQKINSETQALKLLKNFNQILKNDLSFIVCNFIDQLSHANTSNSIVKSMIPNERAFRKAALNWIDNSAINSLIGFIAKNNIQLIITTDHGSILAKKPSILKGNHDHTDNLRYKHGHRITAVKKESLTFNFPENIGLPKNSLASQYIFAKEAYFFTYPNAYHKFASHFQNTYQHGGVSMEEMMVPFIVLQPKK
jgi:DNA-binding response OmpR family regulator